MSKHPSVATRLSRVTFSFLLPFLITSCQKPAEYLYRWEPKIQENPVTEKRPSCNLKVSEASVFVGGQLKLYVEPTGLVTEVKYNKEVLPPGAFEKDLDTGHAGKFEVEVIVEGPAGASSCSAKYEVKELVPLCNLESTPSKVLVGEPVTLILKTTHKISKALIGNDPVAFPVGEKKVVPPKAGEFSVKAFVEGPGGTATCSTTYKVQEHPPTCTLAAKPPYLVIGENVELSLTGSGVITSCTIEEKTVSFPQGKLTLTPTVAGSFVATGKVMGPGGENTCTAQYEVKEKPPTCTIAAKPASAFVGEKIVLTLTGQEKITESLINGTLVNTPVGKLTVTPTLSGFYQGKGEVRGPGGKANCLVNYEIKDLPPACSLVAEPNQVIVGATVKLKLSTTNIITKATIDGIPVNFPIGIKPVVTDLAGQFTAKAEVEGPGGKATCQASYEVKEAAPTCTLSADPPVFLLGGTSVLTLNSTGKVTSAMINNTGVAFPTDKVIVTPTSAGKVKAIGKVAGPGGESTCETNYGVSIVQSFSKIVKEIKVTSDIDILWVIDNSRSMGPFQKSVQDNTEIFMKEYTKVPNLKWKMGLISTTSYHPPLIGFTPQTLLNYESKDPVTLFKNAVGKLGLNGSGSEMTYVPVQNALTNFPQFLRSDAGLAIMIITDAPEQSGIQTQNFVDFLVLKKGDLKNFVGYGAFGAKDLGCTTSEDETPWNYKDSVYEKFINATKGKYFPVCSADFGQKLLDVTKHIIQNQSNTPKILLGAIPVPGTIQIRYKGNLLPEGIKPNGYWTYVATDNSVLFNDLEFATGDKEEVEVTFQTVP